MLPEDLELVSSENSNIKLVLPSCKYEQGYRATAEEVKNIKDESQKEYMSEFDIASHSGIDNFENEVVNPLLSKQTKDRPLDDDGYKLAPGFSFWIIKTDEQGKEDFCGEIIVCPRKLSKIEQKMPSVKPTHLWDDLCDRAPDGSIAPRGAVCSYYLKPGAQGREQGVSKTIAPFLKDISQVLDVPQFTFACMKDNLKSKGILDKMQTQYGGTRIAEEDRYRYFLNTNPNQNLTNNNEKNKEVSNSPSEKKGLLSSLNSEIAHKSRLLR